MGPEFTDPCPASACPGDRIPGRLESLESGQELYPRPEAPEPANTGDLLKGHALQKDLQTPTSPYTTGRIFDSFFDPVFALLS